jgi:glycosyltransferase involved in cell wall biosynthesis
MIRLNYVCFGNSTGYAQAAQDMILALHNSGKYDVRVEYLFASSVKRNGVTSDRFKFLKELTKKDKSLDRIQIYHCIPTSQRYIKPMGKNIGFATFETFDPPSGGALNWINILNKNDAMITPSEFNYKIFAHLDIKKPIYNIPHCYDKNLFNPDIKPLYSHDKFTFLYFGSWRKRKGWQQLIEAWSREFSDQDDVQLLIKTDKVGVAQRDIGNLQKKIGLNKKGIAPILFEKRVLDEVELPRFLKSFDCLISPTYGEGFGLPGMQSMALEVPIIITNFSGCQDYAIEDTATLLEPQGFIMHDCLDNLPQFRNKKWAFVTVESIRKAMRHAIDNQDEIKAKAIKGRELVERKFEYSKVEPLFTEMIEATCNV